MPSEEVKIVVRQESQGDALQKTEEQLKSVEAAGRRVIDNTKVPARPDAAKTPPRSAPTNWNKLDRERAEAGAYVEREAAKPSPKEVRAAQLKSAKEGVYHAEQALADAQAAGESPTTIAALKNDLRSRKLAGRFMREQGMGEEQALRRADTLVASQSAARERAATEKAAAKEAAEQARAASLQEKTEAKEAAKEAADQRKSEVAREKATERERVAASRAALASERKVAGEAMAQQKLAGQVTMRLGRSLVGSGSGAAGALGRMAGMSGMAAYAAPLLAVAAVAKAVDFVATEADEHQGIANRDKAARATNARNLQISRGWRGSASGALSAQFATEDAIFQREQSREEIKRKGERSWVKVAHWFGEKTDSSWLRNMGKGAANWGTHTFESLREQKENEVANKRDKENLQEQKKVVREQFERDGALQLSALRNRSERTPEGQRAAFQDDMRRQFMADYKRWRGQGATEDEAEEAARLGAENAARDRQARFGSGLVDARSGAGDVAAAARWAGAQTDGMEALRAEFRTMRERVEGVGKQQLEQAGRATFDT